MAETWLTVYEFADRLGYEHKAIRRKILSGEIKAHRIAGSNRIRIAESELDKLMRPIPTVEAGRC